MADAMLGLFRIACALVALYLGLRLVRRRRNRQTVTRGIRRFGSSQYRKQGRPGGDAFRSGFWGRIYKSGF